MLSINAGRALIIMGAFVLVTIGSACVVDGGGVPTYDECFDSSDCGAADVCVRVITTDSRGLTRDGNQCSNFCANDGDCTAINGFAGACYMISDDPDFRNFTCFGRCDTDFDCDFNQDCVPVTGPAGPDAICLPAF